VPDLDISQFPGRLPPQDLSGVRVVARFARNDTGRDFVIGDVHGMFTELERLLEEVAFDEGRDRLFSVGDLIDRGPESPRALEWLAQPWFHACRGNHEQFAIDSLDPEQLFLWVHLNGGEWWLALAPEEKAAFRESLRALPLAMEIDTACGLIGIVHADVPPSCTWEGFLERLELGDPDALYYALWSRARLQGLTEGAVRGGVERVYCGHTPVREPALIGNVCYIDTAAAYGREGYADACLTLVEVHPQCHVQHQRHTGGRGL